VTLSKNAAVFKMYEEQKNNAVAVSRVEAFLMLATWHETLASA
jgi:hypothetical protein